MKFSGGRVWWDWWWGFKCVISRLRAVCFLMRWRPLLLPLQAETHPVPRQGSRYGYKEISEALTYEANSQFSRLPAWDPELLLWYNSHQDLFPILTVTTGGQYCHTEGNGGDFVCVCVCWGVGGGLVKVKMKHLSVWGALKCFSKALQHAYLYQATAIVCITASLPEKLITGHISVWHWCC